MVLGKLPARWGFHWKLIQSCITLLHLALQNFILLNKTAVNVAKAKRQNMCCILHILYIYDRPKLLTISNIWFSKLHLFLESKSRLVLISKKVNLRIGCQPWPDPLPFSELPIPIRPSLLNLSSLDFLQKITQEFTSSAMQMPMRVDKHKQYANIA